MDRVDAFGVRNGAPLSSARRRTFSTVSTQRRRVSRFWAKNSLQDQASLGLERNGAYTL